MPPPRDAGLGGATPVEQLATSSASGTVRRSIWGSWYHASPLRAALAPLIWFCCALSACAENPAPESADDPPAPAAKPRRPAPRWARFAEVAAWPSVTPKPFRSSGHGAAGTLVSVRVPESMLESYRALRPGLAVPSGTLVAAFHTDERTSNPGPVYVMERVGDAWKYSAFDAEGRATEHGALALCERCHAESPSGGLFGLPR